MSSDYERYAAYESNVADKGDPMELESRHVGCAMRLWDDASLNFVANDRVQQIVRRVLALEFANKADRDGEVAELTRLRDDDRNDSGVRFDLRLTLGSFAAVGPANRRIAGAFDAPDAIQAAVRRELRMAGQPCKTRVRVVEPHGELETPRGARVLPRQTKIFPTKDTAVEQMRARLGGIAARADAAAAGRQLVLAKAKRVRSSGGESGSGGRYWQCHLCANKNGLGTLACSVCKRASSYNPKSAVAVRAPRPMALHGEGPTRVSVEQVLAMHRQGVDFDARDFYGLAALHCCAQAGRMRLVDALLRCGADAEAVTKDEWRPLHYAANAGSSETVERLLQAGVGTSCLTKAAGHAPLHLCAAANTAHAAQTLLDKGGVDVDVVSRVTGQTPLHLAAWHGSLETVEVLLKANANIAATDREGWVPLQLAQFRDNVAVEHLLLDNSAKQGSWDDDLWRSVKANANKVPTKKR